MNFFIALGVFIYSLILGSYFLYLRNNLANSTNKRKRENIWSTLLIITSLLLAIAAVMSIMNIFGWIKNSQPLLVFGLAMLQLCIFEDDNLRNKSKLLYLGIGIVLLLVNLVMVMM